MVFGAFIIFNDYIVDIFRAILDFVQIRVSVGPPKKIDSKKCSLQGKTRMN